MPWWSTRTIERKFDALIKDGLLITGNYNKLGADRTLWYRVNYEEITLRLASLAGGGNWSNMATGQNGRMDSPEWQDGLAQNGRMDSPEWQDGTAHNGKMDSSECQDGTAQSGSMDDSNWQDGLVQNGKMDGSKMAAPIPLANTSTKTSTKTAHETDAAAQHTEVEYSPQDVQEHIKKQWGPTIDIRTIRKLLKRWGGQRIYRQVTYITRTKSPDELQAIDNPAGYLTDACAVDYHAQWLKAQSV
jgi:hypothetical protein